MVRAEVQRDRQAWSLRSRARRAPSTSTTRRQPGRAIVKATRHGASSPSTMSASSPAGPSGAGGPAARQPSVHGLRGGALQQLRSAWSRSRASTCPRPNGTAVGNSSAERPEQQQREPAGTALDEPVVARRLPALDRAEPMGERAECSAERGADHVEAEVDVRWRPDAAGSSASSPSPATAARRPATPSSTLRGTEAPLRTCAPKTSAPSGM